MFKHPKGLYILFFTEMWERFSFYGMKALLIFFLTKHHFFSDSISSEIVGNYSALVYAIPVIGGFLADRFLGSKRAIIYGAILLSLGHLGMTIEGHQAYYEGSTVVRDHAGLQFFYISLGLIIMGVGFLKPNISTIVGTLYAPGDPKRDSGFTIFYMGINLGAFLATLICGAVGETYGWRYGFGLAGIGMITGLIVFLLGQKHLKGKGDPEKPERLKEKFFGINREAIIYLGGLAGVIIMWQLVQLHLVVGAMLAFTALAFLAFLTWFIITQTSKEERGRLIVLIILFVFSVIFWSLFEQEFISLNLFADRSVNRVVNIHFSLPLIGDININELKASTLLSLNPLYIILLGPLFAWLWIRLSRVKREPNTPVKFGMGVILAGLAFGILVLGILFTGQSEKVHLVWLVLAYLLLTSGELCLSPVGLSAVTKLSVQKIVGVMMGAWFLSTAAAEYIAALLSKMASVETTGGKVVDTGKALVAYSQLFTLLMYVGLGAGILLIIFSPLLKKHMHGIR